MRRRELPKEEHGGLIQSVVWWEAGLSSFVTQEPNRVQLEGIIFFVMRQQRAKEVWAKNNHSPSRSLIHSNTTSVSPAQNTETHTHTHTHTRTHAHTHICTHTHTHTHTHATRTHAHTHAHTHTHTRTHAHTHICTHTHTHTHTPTRTHAHTHAHTHTHTHAHTHTHTVQGSHNKANMKMVYTIFKTGGLWVTGYESLMFCSWRWSVLLGAEFLPQGSPGIMDTEGWGLNTQNRCFYFSPGSNLYIAVKSKMKIKD